MVRVYRQIKGKGTIFLTSIIWLMGEIIVKSREAYTRMDAAQAMRSKADFSPGNRFHAKGMGCLQNFTAPFSSLYVALCYFWHLYTTTTMLCYDYVFLKGTSGPGPISAAGVSC